MPKEISDWVISLRQKVDPALLHMPVEITLSGSSGVGTLIEGQNFDRIKNLLVDSFANTLPFEFSFRGITTFPKTEIYYLDPDPDIFRSMHAKLAESDLEFKESPFPYSPHCSVAGFTPITDETRAIIRAADSPKGKHTVSSISIYRNEKMNPVELWRYEPKKLPKPGSS